MDTEAFHIAIGDDALRDLHDRLTRVRWPRSLAGTGWTEGTDAAFMERLVAHWRDHFDWRAQEARLNTLPQFMATVDDQPIHFVHQRGTGPDPFPLVLTHGWPGSFV
ncbi:MAG: epoxide hydrolase N-terminal domain-containing protein, partial [Rhodoferax sp.]|nr:epoxide hydrolase N-terminal domain-containing protein [Rhodoferax sp.]